jgi:sugar transferase (PEP-CTERM system associated)
MNISGIHIARINIIVAAVEAFLLGAIFLLFQTLGHGAAIQPITSVGDFASLVVFPSAIFITGILSFGIYQISALRSPLAYLDRLIVGALLSLAVIVGVNLLIFDRSLAIGQLVAAVSSGCGIVIAGRILGRYVLLGWRPIRPRSIVLGGGARASLIWEACGDLRPTRLQAFLSTPDEGHPLSGCLPSDRLREMPSDLVALARAEGADEIVVALDDRRGSMPVDALFQCRMHGLRVVDSATFLERETGKVDLDGAYPSWLIFSHGFKRSPFGDTAKRAMDVVLSMALLIATLPLLAMVTLAIKLDSPGPVFYRQARVGLRGQIFSIYKFRSMVTDAEGSSGAKWAQAGDPRITRVGRFIRRTRIDEIPQVLNVLKGEMSFVGPRPERPEFVKELIKDIRFYNERHRATPGLTGWAQINYPYGASVKDANEKLKYDLYYLKNKSLLLDVFIILQTLRIVVFGEGVR